MGNASNHINFHVLRYGKRNRPAQTADYTRGPLINYTSKTKISSSPPHCNCQFWDTPFCGQGSPPRAFPGALQAPAVPVLRVLGQRPNMQKGSGYIPPPCLRNCKPLAGYIACPVYESMRPLPAWASMSAPVSLFQKSNLNGFSCAGAARPVLQSSIGTPEASPIGSGRGLPCSLIRNAGRPWARMSVDVGRCRQMSADLRSYEAPAIP